MSRASLSELYERLCVARNTFPEGCIIRHTKSGDLYVVTDHTIREFDGVASVTYEKGPIKFTRPVYEMVELIDHDGCIMPRFEVMNDD